MGRHLSAVERDEVKVCAEAANRDSGALTALSLNRNAGDALQCLCQVGIWEIADILGGDGINNAARVTLGIHRALEARANAGDYHLFNHLLVGDLILSGHGTSE